jgi:hypothetical protein
MNCRTKLPLLATSIAGLGLLGWRRKQKVQAANHLNQRLIEFV